MLFKLILLISISLIFLSYGVLWYGKSLNSEIRYDFKEDLKRTFFTPHGTYSGSFNDAKPRRIVPAVIFLSGILIFAVGLIKLL